MISIEDTLISDGWRMKMPETAQMAEDVKEADHSYRAVKLTVMLACKGHMDDFTRFVWGGRERSNKG